MDNITENRITAGSLAKVNKDLPTVNMKGKPYVLVKDRVAAFRSIMPSGFIKSEVISESGTAGNMEVTVKATVGYYSLGAEIILAEGIAHEKEKGSYINATSLYENAQTSAIGRAIGFLGIGIDAGIASYEEVKSAEAAQKRAAAEVPAADNVFRAAEIAAAVTELLANKDAAAACTKKETPEEMKLALREYGNTHAKELSAEEINAIRSALAYLDKCIMGDTI